MKAIFSECGTYRYTLWRTWAEPLVEFDARYVNFICLNPSTADEVKDDNTIRKCVKFAKSWGYQVMCVTNLFGYRSTDPKVLKTLSDPIGPENDSYLVNVAAKADLVVAAWSQYGSLFGRSIWMRSMIHRPIHYLRLSKEPWHPLYLPDNSKPILWEKQYDRQHTNPTQRRERTPQKAARYCDEGAAAFYGTRL